MDTDNLLNRALDRLEELHPGLCFDVEADELTGYFRLVAHDPVTEQSWERQEFTAKSETHRLWSEIESVLND